MESVCYRCGGPVEEQTSFCPSCGAPQIRVSARESQAPQPQEPAPPPALPANALPTPVVLLRVGQPDQIHWKSFLRIASPLAAVVGFFTTYNPLLTWLVLLPGSVFLAIRLYRRRQPGPLKTAQGAKLGALIGLLAFGVLAVFLVVIVAHDPAAYRHGVEKTLQDMFARNPNPEAEQIAKAMFGSPGGIAFFAVLGMAILLVFLLTIGGVSGALAAALSREKSP